MLAQELFPHCNPSEVLNDLEERFSGGERLAVVDIMHEYLSPGTGFKKYAAERVVRGWIQTLKNRFKSKHGLYFGCVDDMGNFGIALNRGDYAFILNSYYKQAQSIVKTAFDVKREAQNRQMLPDGKAVKLLGFHAQGVDNEEE